MTEKYIHSETFFSRRIMTSPSTSSYGTLSMKWTTPLPPQIPQSRSSFAYNSCGIIKFPGIGMKEVPYCPL